MYHLFELAKLLSVSQSGKANTSKNDINPEITHVAWKEVGEASILSLYCSNGYLILRHCITGHVPVCKQLQWIPNNAVISMCFDSSATWLLVLVEYGDLYIIPALSLLDKKVKVNHLWKVDDITLVYLRKYLRGTPTSVTWWHTLEDQHIAIVSTKLGELWFVDLLKRKVIITDTAVDAHVQKLDILQDDEQLTRHLLITSQSGMQWRMLLERTDDIMTLVETETQSLKPNEITGSYITSVLSVIEQTRSLFTASLLPKFNRTVTLSPEYAKGRHLVAVHCTKTSTYQVFDSNIEHSPLFVYKVPVGSEKVIFTDKVMFALQKLSDKRLLVLSNQKSETSLDSSQGVNEESVLQQFVLSQDEHILMISKKCFPFYWHEKRVGTRNSGESLDDVLPASQLIHIPNHTVLDGCIIISNHAVYECRPSVSPECLFIDCAVSQSDSSNAELLGISLGLNVNVLYEMAAEFLLKSNDYNQAARLFQLSKCPHLKRVASFARHGRLNEAMVYVEQIFTSRTADIASTELQSLADIALLCYIFLIQESKEDSAKLTDSFRDFLLFNFSYDEMMALNLLVKFNMLDFLFEVSKARGMIIEALGALLKDGHHNMIEQHIEKLIGEGYSPHLSKCSQGSLLYMLDRKTLLTVLCMKPELALQYAELVMSNINNLNEDELLDIAKIFDPSKQPVKRLLSDYKNPRRRTASIASLCSTSSDTTESKGLQAVSVNKLIELFLVAVLLLNKRKGSCSLEPSDLFPDETDMPWQTESLTASVKTNQHVVCKPSVLGCGPHHAATVRNGDLYVWGRNQSGRLGIGLADNTKNIIIPTRVETFHILQIKVLSVACGGSHTIVLTHQGVYGLGCSKLGQVGTGTRHIYYRPMLLDDLVPLDIIAVECGQYHSLALTSDGKVYSWGWGVYGQLGHGDPEDCLTPTLVTGLRDKVIIKVTAGYAHTLALTSEGEVYVFGCGYFGQLGLGNHQKSNVPVKLDISEERIVLLTTKCFHSVAVTSSNKVYMWGCHPQNLRYRATTIKKARQVGHGLVDPIDMFLSPQLVDTSLVNGKIVQVACGSFHTMILTEHGYLYGWGRNLDGQLGTGNKQDVTVPSMLTSINDRQISRISLGGEYTMAVDSDNLVWVWGRNDYGQLGIQRDNPTDRHSRKKEQTTQKGANYPPDISMPVVLHELPTVMSFPPLWRQASLTHSTDSSDSESWISNDSDPALLYHGVPNLSNIGSILYSRKIFPVLLKYLGDIINTKWFLRKCENFEDWASSAIICNHLSLVPQALHYHLRALSKVMEAVVERFLSLSMEIVKFHIRNLQDQQDMTVSSMEENIRLCVIEIFNHWSCNSLPVDCLESFFHKNVDVFGLVVSTFLFRGSTKEDSIVSLEAVTKKFTSKFKLNILSYVIEGLNSDLTKQYPSVYTYFKQLSETNMDVELNGSNAGEKMVSFERLWQEIIRNLKKVSDTKNHIALSRSDVDHLETQVLSDCGEESDDSINVENRDSEVVLFTCGHHYTKATFQQQVTKKLQESGHEVQKLTESIRLLTQYYSREGFLPLACPRCVINSLHKIS